MDAIRESAGKSLAQTIALAAFVSVFLVPVGFFIQQAFFSDSARMEPLWDGSSVPMIGLTIYRTILQAGVSTSVTLFLGAALGALLAFGHFPLQRPLQSLVETFGAFCFALPGVSVAMFVLLSSKIFPMMPSKGLFAIVLAHVFMNFLFVATQFYYFFAQWLHRDGQDQIEAAASLGARKSKIFFGLVLRHAMPRFFEFGLPTFFYSMMAFSTVLILGGSPQQATPEVLLFYFSAQDPTLLRLRLALPIFALSFFVAQYFFYKFALKSQIRYRPASMRPEAGFFFRARRPVFTIIAGLFLVPVVGFFLLPILELRSQLWQHGAQIENEFIESTVISILLSLYSGILGWAAFHLLLRCRSSFHQFFSQWMVFSPMMLMLFWMSTPAYGWVAQSSQQVQFAFLGALIALTQFPLISKWIEDRKQAVEKEVYESAAVLGTSPEALPSRLLAPLMKDFEMRVFSFLALKSFGEIALASFVAPDLPLLSLVSRQFAARYNFFGVSWILLVMGLMCVLLLGLQNAKYFYWNRAWFKGRV